MFCGSKLATLMSRNLKSSQWIPDGARADKEAAGRPARQREGTRTRAHSPTHERATAVDHARTRSASTRLARSCTVCAVDSLQRNPHARAPGPSLVASQSHKLEIRVARYLEPGNEGPGRSGQASPGPGGRPAAATAVSRGESPATHVRTRTSAPSRTRTKAKLQAAADQLPGEEAPQVRGMAHFPIWNCLLSQALTAREPQH
jgi:hypothetical protein